MTYCASRSTTNRNLRITSLRLRDFSASQEVRNEFSQTVHRGRRFECRAGGGADMEVKAESAFATNNGRTDSYLGVRSEHDTGRAATGSHPTDPGTYAGHRCDVRNR